MLILDMLKAESLLKLELSNRNCQFLLLLVGILFNALKVSSFIEEREKDLSISSLTIFAILDLIQLWLTKEFSCGRGS
jgi:hypothetical protein